MAEKMCGDDRFMAECMVAAGGSVLGGGFIPIVAVPDPFIVPIPSASSSSSSDEMTVNPPFGLSATSANDDGLFCLFDDNKQQKTRSFFVPPGYMRVSLEETRAVCCPPGLYDMEPHEMFQSVAMKFCPPNVTSDYDAVVDLPLGDFTQSVLLRQPTADIFDLHLIVQARITKMKKFALANSSNPGAVVYMILRNEIVQHLQSRRSPGQISSKPVLDAVNGKTAEIGLAIRSIFVDNIIRDRRRRPSSPSPPLARVSTASMEQGSAVVEPNGGSAVSSSGPDGSVAIGAGAVVAAADDVDGGDVDDDADDDSQYMVIQQPANIMQK